MKQSLLSQWLDVLAKQQRLSPHTVAAYRRDMQKLWALYPEHELQTIDAALIRQGLAQLHAAGEQPRSLARRLSAWRRFFQWFHEQYGPHPNPCKGIRAPKAPQPLPRALSVEQTQQLLDARPLTGPPSDTPDQTEILAYRDQALFELFYSCGLRLAELVALDYRYIDEAGYRSHSWLNTGNQELRVSGKGQQSRLVPIGRHALQALEYWLSLRTLLLPAILQQQPAADFPHSAALFLGARGRRIHPRVIQKALAARAREAGLPEHVHPHRLRHSFASHILQSSQDLRAVQELLGHQSIRSTQIYTRLDFQHLAQIYDQAHPRAKKNNDPER